MVGSLALCPSKPHTCSSHWQWNTAEQGRITDHADKAMITHLSTNRDRSCLASVINRGLLAPSYRGCYTNVIFASSFQKGSPFPVFVDVVSRASNIKCLPKSEFYVRRYHLKFLLVPDVRRHLSVKNSQFFWSLAKHHMYVFIYVWSTPKWSFAKLRTSLQSTMCVLCMCACVCVCVWKRSFIKIPGA